MDCVGTKLDFVCRCSIPSGKSCRTNFTCPNIHDIRCKNSDNCLNTCNKRFVGREYNEHKCIKNYCANNGSCYINDNKPFCVCDKHRFAGQYCQFKCRLACFKGLCLIKNNEISCSCENEYESTNCQIKKIFIQKVLEHNFEFYIYYFALIIIGILIILATFLIQLNGEFRKYYLMSNDKTLTIKINTKNPVNDYCVK
ncbi:hypothetical protein MXB_5014 [Myxobolus squamalis]|nr:hypothetical protein MXB_5014 [Myxobolus squamalis]